MTMFDRARDIERDDEEATLWAAFTVKPTQHVREALFNFHLGLAKALARHHFLDRNRGDIEYPDLLQLASAGLLEAIDRYDPQRAIPFQAYARRRISGSIVDGIAKMSEFREQHSFRKRLQRERVQSLLPTERETTDPYAAFSEIAVGLALGIMLEGTGLVAAEDTPAITATAYESLAWSDTLRSVRKATETLSERERAIIYHHYEAGLTFVDCPR